MYRSCNDAVIDVEISLAMARAFRKYGRRRGDVDVVHNYLHLQGARYRGMLARYNFICGIN